MNIYGQTTEIRIEAFKNRWHNEISKDDDSLNLIACYMSDENNFSKIIHRIKRIPPKYLYLIDVRNEISVKVFKIVKIWVMCSKKWNVIAPKAHISII